MKFYAVCFSSFDLFVELSIVFGLEIEFRAMFRGLFWTKKG